MAASQRDPNHQQPLEGFQKEKLDQRPGQSSQDEPPVQARESESSAMSDPSRPTSASSGSAKGGRRDQGTGKRTSRRDTRQVTRAKAAAQSDDTAGAELERRVARLEFAEGALARLRVPVRVSGDPGRSVLTDLDVVALDVDKRLRVSRSILECKSGKGQAGEADRLLWLSGLRDFVGAERGVLVRPVVTRRGRTVATELRLEVLDIALLKTREHAHAWLPDRFGHIDGEACTYAEDRTDTQLKGLGHITGDLIAFLRYDALLAQSHRCLSALDTLRRQVDSGGILPEPTATVVAGHSLMALVLAAIQDAAQLDAIPVDQLRRRTELALTVGSPDDDHLLVVLGRADEVMKIMTDRVHDAYAEGGANRQHVEIASLQKLVGEPPGWVGRYLDLVEAFRSNPAVASELPQTVELACFEGLVGDQRHGASAFDHLFTPEHRYLIIAALACIREVVGSQLAGRLEGIRELDFGRSAPTLPDRTAGQNKPTDVELAQGALRPTPVDTPDP
jgi:hypothetical protein